jgi:hypothetical protein
MPREALPRKQRDVASGFPKQTDLNLPALQLVLLTVAHAPRDAPFLLTPQRA